MPKEVLSGAPDPSSEPILELDGVSVRYAGAPTPALTGLNLTVAAGEVAALLGANGAGKSTLLRVAAGLVAPAGGTVRLENTDIQLVDRPTLARSVAFVPQSEAVPVGFSVRDIVAMGRAPHQGRWMQESDVDRAIIDEAVTRCDLGPLSARTMETLSAGEQRRVAIARALAQRPRVLLLDEPAAFLDVRHRLRFYVLLSEAASRNGIACAVAMHDLDAATRFASSIVLMRDGRVIAHGKPSDVMTTERLQAAFAADVVAGIHEPSGQRYFLPLKAL